MHIPAMVLGLGVLGTLMVGQARAVVFEYEFDSVQMTGENGSPDFDLSANLQVDTSAGTASTNITTPTDTYSAGVFLANGSLFSDAAVFETSLGGVLEIGPVGVELPGNTFLGQTYNIPFIDIFELAELDPGNPDSVDLVTAGVALDVLATVIGDALPIPGGTPEPGPDATSVISGDAFVYQEGNSGGVEIELEGIADPGSTPDIVDISGVEVEWVDENTVDIVLSQDAGPSNLFFSLLDLDFALDGVSKPIVDVSYNRFGSGVNEFLGDIFAGQPGFNEFSEPSVSFTDTSFTASYDFLDPRLIADQITHRFDITTAPAIIPLPASILMMLAALGGFHLLRIGGRTGGRAI